MGINYTDISSFLEPESKGFLYDTARSFLQRHSNAESLLAQLTNLVAMGQLDTCEDMIQLVLREGHSLGDSSSLYLLRAQIAFEKGEGLGEVMAWLQQAKLCQDENPELQAWDLLIAAKLALKDGDYDNGLTLLEDACKQEAVSKLAQYEWAHHLFWKNISTDKTIAILEEVTSERPGFVQAWSTLAYAYNKSGDKGKAQQAFGQCIELDSNPERVKIYKQQLAS